MQTLYKDGKPVVLEGKVLQVEMDASNAPDVTVEQTDTGATITIKDKSGTTTATVKNGEDGAPGIVLSGTAPTDPNHPVWIDPDGDEDEETVTSVNGQSGDVTITAESLGALTEDNLQSATNTALAQAKASGEFDGAQGQKGETGPQGPTGPAGAGLDVTGATVGQIVKISAVDDSGVPTAWVPVDMPSGVNPVSKSDTMTESVGVDANGGLWVDTYSKAHIDAALGTYITDIDTLIGGDTDD